MKTQSKKITLASLIASSNIPEKLVRAVIRQIGGWESFTQSAPDISSHGIDGGFHGFIDYSETATFSRLNMGAIKELAREQAEDMGVSTFDMVASFGCFRHDKPDADEIAEAIYRGKEG